MTTAEFHGFWDNGGIRPLRGMESETYTLECTICSRLQHPMQYMF